MKYKTSLTAKQAKYISNIANGMNKTQAAYDAYDVNSRESASAIANVNGRKESIRQHLIPALRNLGITLEKSLKPIADGLDANHKVTIEGDVIDTGEPDINTRLRASDRALKLLGVYDQVSASKTNEEYSKEELTALSSESDEIEMSKIVFKKLA